MQMRLYSVFDRLAEESGPLFEAKNDLVAWRNFRNLLEKSSSPNEYYLLCFGTIDHDTNVVSLEPNPRVIEGIKELPHE